MDKNNNKYNLEDNRIESIEHEIIIEGFAEIQNGDTIIRARNHAVDRLLLSLVNTLSLDNMSGNAFTFAHTWTTAGNPYCYMVLGSDPTTPTTNDMTMLVTPKGTAPGTKANVQGIMNTNPSAGVYQVVYTATWNPLSTGISGILGEIGLYLYMWSTLQSAGGTATARSANFASRLSVADGDFSSFTIDTSKPVVVQWTIQFSFT